MNTFLALCVQGIAAAQETVNVYPDVVPQGSSGHPAGEMAGWGGMIISVVIGTVITLDKFGVLSRLGSSSNSAPVAPAAPAQPDPNGLESIHTRLATMETRLAAVEQTVTSIDARDRADAAALARMEGQMSAWDARLLRIENAVVNRNNGQ